MVNTNIFSTKNKSRGPATNAVNSAGGKAYDNGAEQSLAQLASTGCMGDTFYADATDQTKKIIELAAKVSPEFIGKTAVYARQKGYMKDMPALLCAILAANKNQESLIVLKKIFPKVMNNSKMMRNFVQIIRSGELGRKSMGTAVKKLVQNWFDSRSVDQLFKDSIGTTPSMADVIKMVHPKPSTPEHAKFYAYMIGKEVGIESLPGLVKDYELYKKTSKGNIPDVPFQLLTSLNLGTDEWTEIAKMAPWHMTRMNLNTFERHGVFKKSKMVDMVADRLRSESDIKKSKVFPYQLFAAYSNIEPSVPMKIKNALQDALEIATQNIPKITGKVLICVDVSRSMQSPITGHRGVATTKVQCIDAATLIAASILRINPDAVVVPFSDRLYEQFYLNPKDSIVTNANKLKMLPSGGTACWLPILQANQENKNYDAVIMLSDNESWMNTRNAYTLNGVSGSTDAMSEWLKLKSRNKSAKLINIDITPSSTSQFANQKDVLNIGGMSDNVFSLIADFIENGNNPSFWVDTIKNVTI